MASVKMSSMSVLSVMTLATEAQLVHLEQLMSSVDNKPAILALRRELGECKISNDKVVAAKDIADRECTNLRSYLRDANTELVSVSDKLKTANETVIATATKLDLKTAEQLRAVEHIKAAAAEALQNEKLLAVVAREEYRQQNQLQLDVIAEKEEAVRVSEVASDELLKRCIAAEDTLASNETALAKMSDGVEESILIMHNFEAERDKLTETHDAAVVELEKQLVVEREALAVANRVCSEKAYDTAQTLSACTVTATRFETDLRAAREALSATETLKLQCVAQLDALVDSKRLVDTEIATLREELQRATAEAELHVSDVAARSADEAELVRLHNELVEQLKLNLGECNASADTSKSKLSGEISTLIAKADADAAASVVSRDEAAHLAETISHAHLASIADTRSELAKRLKEIEEANAQISVLEKGKATCDTLLDESAAAVYSAEEKLAEANIVSTHAIKECAAAAASASESADVAMESLRTEHAGILESNAAQASLLANESYYVLTACESRVTALLAERDTLQREYDQYKVDVAAKVAELGAQLADAATDLENKRNLLDVSDAKLIELYKIADEAVKENENMLEAHAKSKEETTVNFTSELAACQASLDDCTSAMNEKAQVQPVYDCVKATTEVAGIVYLFAGPKRLMKSIDDSIKVKNVDDTKKLDKIIQYYKNTKSKIEATEMIILNKIKDGVNGMLSCDDTTVEQYKYVLTTFARNQRDLDSLFDNLANQFEDLCGAVRVYIRVKPKPTDGEIKLATVGTDNKMISVKCIDTELVAYGPFYGVFGGDTNNTQLFEGINDRPDVEMKDKVRGLVHSFDQIKHGYSILLFGYGLSGSGKTYSLLGNGTNSSEGVLHIGLRSLNEKGSKIKNINMLYLFEEYIDSYEPTTGVLRGKIIMLRGDSIRGMIPGVPTESFTSESAEFSKTVAAAAINMSDLHIGDITPLTQVLEKWRSGDGQIPGPLKRRRVSKTPNNDLSSRSHLFMVFAIQFENETTGHITIVDTAGRESPAEIRTLFLNTSVTGCPTLGSMIGKSWDETADPSPSMRKTVQEWKSLKSVAIQRYTKREFQQVIGLMTAADVATALGRMKESTSGPKGGVIPLLTDMENSLLPAYSVQDEEDKKPNPFRTVAQETQYNLKGDLIDASKRPPRWYRGKANKKYYSAVEIHTILTESLYINETINHLTYYFKGKKQDVRGTDIKYQPNGNYDTHPYDQTEFFKNPAEVFNLNTKKPATPISNCHVIPILQFLDQLGTGTAENYKPTKFVLLMCVREEESKCKDTVSTLQFGDTIRST